MSCLQVLSLPSRLLRAHFLPPHASDAGHPAIVCVKGMSLFGGQSLKSEGAHALVGAGVATAFSLLLLGCSSHEAQGQKAGPSEKDLSFLLTLVAAPALLGLRSSTAVLCVLRSSTGPLWVCLSVRPPSGKHIFSPFLLTTCWLQGAVAGPQGEVGAAGVPRQVGTESESLPTVPDCPWEEPHEEEVWSVRLPP